MESSRKQPAEDPEDHVYARTFPSSPSENRSCEWFAVMTEELQVLMVSKVSLSAALLYKLSCLELLAYL